MVPKLTTTLLASVAVPDASTLALAAQAENNAPTNSTTINHL